MDRIDAMRLFVRLAELKSFSAAARELKLKQSTASKWVSELEQQLGLGLVERTTRSLQLTEAGRLFLRHCGEVLSAFDHLTQELQAQSPEPSGRLRISAPVVFGGRFVLPLLASFMRQHPKVSVDLLFNDRYVNLVEEGFDLAIRVGVPVDTSARGKKLAESTRCLVAAPCYLEARGRPSSPRELKAHECLLLGDASAVNVWRFGHAPSAEAPIQVRGRFAANNSEAILHMARAGLGLALLADWLVADDLSRGSLVWLREFQAPPAPIFALTPPGRYTSPAVRALVEHLAASLCAGHEAS